MSGEDISPEVDTRTTEELDRLGDTPEGPSQSNKYERPMTSDKTAEAKQAKEEFEFVHSGKTIKGTKEQLIKWAQLGYDRPQAMQKFNQEKAKWEQERQAWEQSKSKYAPYEQIDAWAAKNPDQWQKIQQMWQQAQSGQFQTGAQQNLHTGGVDLTHLQPYLSKISTLEQQVSSLLPQFEQLNQERTQAKVQSEDEALDNEVRSIQEKYKDLDWQSLDENGKTLELRVLEHAQQTGIPTFQAAFRDLLHDDLLGRAQAQAKQGVAQTIQNRSKLGVLGESPTSRIGTLPVTKNIRETSYEELEREIKEELRRSRVS